MDSAPWDANVEAGGRFGTSMLTTGGGAAERSIAHHKIVNETSAYLSPNYCALFFIGLAQKRKGLH